MPAQCRAEIIVNGIFSKSFAFWAAAPVSMKSVFLKRRFLALMKS